MLRSLILLGTGGSSYDALDVIEAINADRPTWHVSGFLDDARPVGGGCHGLEVLGRLSDACHFPNHSFLNAIGSDQSYRRRPDIIASTGLPPERFATLIHPGAAVSSRARLGRGVCVNYGVSVAGGVVIGDHVCLCPGAIVGHDTVIEDYALLAPGAVVSGFVRVGRATYVGSGAKVRQRLRLGERSLIGLGAVVVRDVPDGVTVVGNPARSIVPLLSSSM